MDEPAALPRSERDDETVPRTASRRGVLALAGAGAAASLSGCLGSAPGSGGTDTALPEVGFRGHYNRINVTFANYSAAEDYTWPEHGLDVTYKASKGSKAAAKSVSSGKDKFGDGGFGATLQLISNDAPLTVIGTFNGPFGGVISLAETGISDWDDLEGTTLGMNPYGSTGPVGQAAMRAKGVDTSTIEFRNVQPSSAIKTLLSGEVDGLVRYTPHTRAHVELAGKEANVLKSVDALGHLGVALLAHDSVIENKPGRVEKFVAGWLDGIRLWAEDYDMAVDAHKEHVDNWDPEYNEKVMGPILAAQAQPKDIGLDQGKGWVVPEKMETTIDVFADAGLLENRPDAEAVYTNEFIERNQELAVEASKALYDRLEDFEVGPNYI